MNQQPLTQRDLEVVLDLYKYRYLKTSQIQQLYFPSLQTANRRMRSLIDQKLVKHFSVPNVAERIYHISQRGASLVANQLGVTAEDLNWSKNTRAPKDYYFMQHFLGINQFRIDLNQACQNSPVELLGFIPEYFGSKHLSGRITKHIKDFVFDARNPRDKITHTPDAVFALQRDDKPALFFLEIDRGTEVLTNPYKGFLKMSRYYINYAKERKFKSYEQEFNCSQLHLFRLLIITTSEQRLNNMRQAATRHHSSSANVLRYFWLTTFDKVSVETMWYDIWLSLDKSDHAMYAVA